MKGLCHLTLTVADALELDILKPVRVLGGSSGLNREIRWPAVVDIPEVVPWLHGGELLITTGWAWPGKRRDQRSLVSALHEKGLAAVLFATGRFWGAVPAAIVAEAEHCGLPVLEYANAPPFVDITEAIQRRILSSADAFPTTVTELYRRLTDAALRASSLVDIITALSGMIARRVAILDAAFRVTDQVDWDPPPGTAGTPCAIGQTLRRLSEGPPSWPALVEYSGAGQVARGVAYPIALEQKTAGYVCIFEDQRPLTDLDVRAVEHGATIAALHLLRQKSVYEVEEKLRQSVVDMLVRGEFSDHPGLRERAHLAGFDPAGHYAVGILVPADIGGGGGRDRTGEVLQQAARTVRHALQRANMPPLVTVLEDHVTFLLPVSAPGGQQVRFKAAQVLDGVRLLEPRLRFLVTLGGGYSNAAGIARSYREARMASRTAPAPEGVFAFDDLSVLRLLSNVQDEQLLHSLHHATIGKIREHSRDDFLVETLRKLVELGYNRARTAQALRIHRNTLNQRVDRIEEILQDSLGNSSLRLKIELSLDVDKLLVADPRRQLL